MFEPSRDREVLIALDVQTRPGRLWEGPATTRRSSRCSSSRRPWPDRWPLERATFGLAAAGYHGAEQRFAMLPPSEAPGQLERVLDLLARLSSHPSSEFEQLIAAIIRTIRPGTTVVVVTGREPRRISPTCGASSAPAARSCCSPAARMRRPTRPTRGRPGLTARVGRLDGPWQTAGHLDVSSARRPRSPCRRHRHDRVRVARRAGGAGRAEPAEQPTRRQSTPAARGAVARVVELMPLVLVCVAEAAWISVVGGLVQEFTLHQPEIGIAQLAVLVAIGATIAHVAAPGSADAGRRSPSSS